MLKSIVDNLDDKENIFPIELNKEFKIFKIKFDQLTKLQEGVKIGKDKNQSKPKVSILLSHAS